MEHVNYLIIGAGVTGLSFANFVNDKDFLILEQENEIGGYCRTIEQDGFIWDYSGHFFHFQNPEIKEFLVSRMPTDSIIEVIKESKIYYRGSYMDYPFQKNIHQLDREEFLECLHDLYFRKELSDYKNFAEMVYSKFGKAISDKFLIPYNEKLYACPLNQLDSEAMGRFFPYAKMNEIVRNFVTPDNSSYNSTFIYPKNGARCFIDALAKDLDKQRIRINEKVTNIDLKHRTVTTSRGTLSYTHLISSIPFPTLLRLIGFPYKPQDYSWNKVFVFNLGFDKKGLEKVHWIYFPEKKYRFYRVGFYDNILGASRMSLYVEIGLEKNAPVHMEEELATVLRGLEAVGIINGHHLVSFSHVVLDPAYVHITATSMAQFRKITPSLNAVNVYTLGRYGGWKYCSIEDNIIEAKALADTFNLFL